MQEVDRQPQPPLSAAQEQAMKEDMIASAKKVRRVAARLWCLSLPAVCRGAKQLSTTMSWMLGELDGCGETSK